MANKNTNVPAVKAETALSTQAIPEHLKKYVGQGAVGLETMTQEDMIMPRLQVAQAMSPQVVKGDPLFIKGLEVGQFFNTLTNEIYGEGPVRIVPLFGFKSRVYFAPRGSDQMMFCNTNKLDKDGRLIDGRITPEGCELCPHSKFLDEPRADGTTKPDCTLFYNYVVLVDKEEGKVLEPIALSMKSKMIKPAKKFNSIIRVRNMPAFTMLFDLTAKPEKAPKGTFFNLDVQPAGNVSEAMIARTENYFSTLSHTEFKVDLRGADVEDTEEETPF